MEDKQECPNCQGSGIGDVWYHQDENGNVETETIRCDVCDGFGFIYQDSTK